MTRNDQKLSIGLTGTTNSSKSNCEELYTLKIRKLDGANLSIIEDYTQAISTVREDFWRKMTVTHGQVNRLIEITNLLLLKERDILN